VAEAGGRRAWQLGRIGHGRYEVEPAGEPRARSPCRLERGRRKMTVARQRRAAGTLVHARRDRRQRGAANRSTPAIVSWEDPTRRRGSTSSGPSRRLHLADSGITPDDGVMTLQPENVRVRPTQVGRRVRVRLTLDRVVRLTWIRCSCPAAASAPCNGGRTFVSTPAAGEKNGPQSPPARRGLASRELGGSANGCKIRAATEVRSAGARA
jgi:hypothetical protein